MNNEGFRIGKTAVLYARVSSAEQAEKGLSIDNQLEQGRKRAKKLGAEVAREFVDDGLSGRTDKRPDFLEAIDYCELFKPDYLIMWSTSRFFRNKLLAAMYKSRLEKAGVEWVYTSVDIGQKDDAGWLAESVFEIFDEYVSRANASATKASMIKNARAGHFNGGIVPYGYRSMPALDDVNRKRLVPNPDEALIVNQIYDMKSKRSIGSRSIALELNESGLTNRGRKWTKGKITTILKSATVIGQITFNKKNRVTDQIRPMSEWINVNSHEPIVAKDLWESVQKSLGRQQLNCQPRNRHSPFVLSNLLKCGACGAPMTIESAKGCTKRYHYYVCNAARYEKKHAPDRYSADDMDEWLLEVISDQVFNKDSLDEIIQELKLRARSWGSDTKKMRAALVKQIDQVNRKLDSIFEIMEEHGKRTPNLGDLTDRLRKLKAQRIKLENKVKKVDLETEPKLSASFEDVEMMRSFLLEIVMTSPPAKIKKFLQVFIDSIEIKEKNVKINYDTSKLLQTAGIVRFKGDWLPGAGSNHRQAD